MVLAPHSIHTGGKSEVQLTKKQAVLLMHNIYVVIQMSQKVCKVKSEFSNFG